MQKKATRPEAWRRKQREAEGGIEPPPKVLQTLAIPLCYSAKGVVVVGSRGPGLSYRPNDFPLAERRDCDGSRTRILPSDNRTFSPLNYAARQWKEEAPAKGRREPEVGLEPTTKGYEPREPPGYSGIPKGGTRTHIEWHQKPPPCRSATFGPGHPPPTPGGVEPPSTASKAAALPFKLRGGGVRARLLSKPCLPALLSAAFCDRWESNPHA